jgi:hypothetical protein
MKLGKNKNICSAVLCVSLISVTSILAETPDAAVKAQMIQMREAF